MLDPLTKREVSLSQAVGVWPGAKERTALVLKSLGLLLECLVPFAVFLLDELLYSLLSMVSFYTVRSSEAVMALRRDVAFRTRRASPPQIQRHGRIDYQQVGQHSLSVRVRGSGMIAQLVRKIISEFNVHQAVNVRHSNQPCLPRPRRLHWQVGNMWYGEESMQRQRVAALEPLPPLPTSSRWLWLRVALVYLALWLLLVFRAGLGRLHRAVCAYFYPERERRRVLRLYNETLKRRWGMARFMRARVRVLAKQDRLERRHGLARVLGSVLAYWWPGVHHALLVTNTPKHRSHVLFFPPKLSHFSLAGLAGFAEEMRRVWGGRASRRGHAGRGVRGGGAGVGGRRGGGGGRTRAALPVPGLLDGVRRGVPRLLASAPRGGRRGGGTRPPSRGDARLK